MVFPAFAAAETILVPGDYPTIQLAVDAAVNGDTILVDPGTYPENIDLIGKALTLKSEQGPDVTMIDGMQQGPVVSFVNDETALTVLEGFTVANGMGQVYPSLTGGGIHIESSSPEVADNIIRDNSATMGGGIYCLGDSKPSIRHNRIHLNFALDHGGGVYCKESAPLISGNVIYDNTVGSTSVMGWGGGIGVSFAAPVIEENQIFKNYASWAGGGIFCKYTYSGGKQPDIDGNRIHENLGEIRGGGIMLTACEFNVTNNIIHSNTSYYGGGIHQGIPTLISNNIIFQNSADCGGGIYTASEPTLANNTLVSNTALSRGGGFCCDNAASTIVNTIFWLNTAPLGNEIAVGDNFGASVVDISYSDLKGGMASAYVSPNSTLNWGAGMIDADPLFLDPGDEDFHLGFDSPCKDTGTVLGATSEDFEGDPRPTFGAVDMGADEVHDHLYYTGDATPGGMGELKVIGAPGTAPVRIWLGSGAMDPPLPTKFGDWHLQFPLLAQVELGSIPPPEGVLVLPFILPPDMPAPASLYMQAGAGANLTNLCVIRVW